MAPIFPLAMITSLPFFAVCKVINLYDKDKRHQFYNEFEMLHDTFPSFVQYHGIFFNEGLINLVMEFMDCGSI